MEKTIKARFKNGVIELLDNFEFDENKEFLITVKDLPKEDRFKKSIGSWKGTIDCEQLIKDIYESRELSTGRTEVKL